MKKIILNEKAKKIIAWIMLVIMGIFSAIGIMTCLGGIYSCATKEETEIKKVYAAEEDESITYNIKYMNYQDYNQDAEEMGAFYQQTQNIYFQFTKQAFNIVTPSNESINKPYVTYEGIINNTPTYKLHNIRFAYYPNNEPSTAAQDITLQDMIVKINAGGHITKNTNGITFNYKPNKAIYYQGNASYLPDKKQYGFVFGNEENKGDSIEIYFVENTVTQNYRTPKTTSIDLYQATDNTTYQKGYYDGNKNKEEYGRAQKEVGRQEGIAEANKYSFTGLISAVFDVPIQTLYGMLNFEILGVNILTVITSVLSIGLIIFVLKLIFG